MVLPLCFVIRIALRLDHLKELSIYSITTNFDELIQQCIIASEHTGVMEAILTSTKLW